MNCGRVVGTFGFFLLARAATAGIALPIYIEDNHAGSFYWLAEHLNLDEPVTLIHFDAHSDASAVFDSDEIRTRLRRVASGRERSKRLRAWRARGVVQCFDWIEPLMPSPVARVIWVPADTLDETGRQSIESGAREQLDGQAEASPRAGGRFAERARVVPLDQLTAEKIEGAVVATIDLDYFAKYPRNQQAGAFERVWNFVSQLRNLRAVTIAISRPYLRDDDEAGRLVKLALRSALSLPTASVHFEPFATVGNDRSLRAREYRAHGREVPAFDVTKAAPNLKALLLATVDRVGVRTDARRWQDLLRAWRRESPAYQLAIADHQPSTDGIWRLRADEEATVEVRAEPWDQTADRVEWIAQVPMYSRCNLTANSADEIGFAQGAPPRPRWREVMIASSDPALPIKALRDLFDSKTGCGAVRIFARIVHRDQVRETRVLEVRRSIGTGFRAALTEQFGLPYLYGSGLLRDRENTGPETGWGADCANFLVYALRRQGHRTSWSNPRQFRTHLEPLASCIKLDEAPMISEEDLERGLFLHFGTHVAALMEDRPPTGRLNADDVVAHQLEGAAELLSIGELLRNRSGATFDLLRTPAAPEADLTIGGDVMLGRSVGEAIKSGADPFAGVRESLEHAPLRAINLECVVSEAGAADPLKRYSFRAPPDAIATLVRAGIQVVGLANNHAGDFGRAALLDCVTRLRGAGIAVAGAGANVAEAHAPQIVTTATGKRIAVIAVSDAETGIAPQADSASIATTANRTALAKGIQQGRTAGDMVIAMVHWGDENTAVVNERQRELARWLVNEGVDVIAGSHPHCLQPLDFYHGRPIAYSLGNLIFDGAPTVPGWNAGGLLNIAVDRSRSAASVTTLPIHLDRRGFPSTGAATR